MIVDWKLEFDTKFSYRIIVDELWIDNEHKTIKRASVGGSVFCVYALAFANLLPNL